MTRITNQSQMAMMLRHIQNAQAKIAKHSQEVSTGLKVSDPGDSSNSGSIAEFNAQITRLESYEQRAEMVGGQLEFQDEIMRQANEVIIRAKEVATQGANETLSAADRETLAVEIFQLRDQFVSLANSTYQGEFVFGGTDNDSQPFAQDPTSFTEFNASIPGSEFHYTYNATNGAQMTRDVQITDSVTMTVNTPGDQIFQNGINALEEIGRSLAGYATNDVTMPGDVANIAYVFPADYATQTTDIQAGLDVLEISRTDDIMTEQVDIAGRLNRLQSVGSVLEATKFAAKDVLSGLQEVNMDEAISNFGNAQTALQAAYAISSQMQSLTILNYL